ncbi:hypothetical protein ACJMK2_042215 [Sinanodonta woodiana]|uniref:Uncharacterized protein n=1 Tax=Sinanodonta woodiana TaxID=1069815 RepID=A0ABD3W6P5_SINWO
MCITRNIIGFYPSTKQPNVHYGEHSWILAINCVAKCALRGTFLDFSNQQRSQMCITRNIPGLYPSTKQPNVHYEKHSWNLAFNSAAKCALRGTFLNFSHQQCSQMCITRNIPGF